MPHRDRGKVKPVEWFHTLTFLASCHHPRSPLKVKPVEWFHTLTRGALRHLAMAFRESKTSRVVSYSNSEESEQEVNKLKINQDETKQVVLTLSPEEASDLENALNTIDDQFGKLILEYMEFDQQSIFYQLIEKLKSIRC